MTKSYNTDRYPDADYTPNDIEPPCKPAQNEGFSSKEEEAEYYEKLAEMQNDQIAF